MLHFKQQKGFSLIELMLVVVIIAVMAGAVSVGFRSFLGSVGVRNVTEHISDVLHQLDLETAIEEYEKSTVYFENEYLLVDSELADTNLLLSWEAPSVDCVGAIKLTSSDEALLYIRNATLKSLRSPLRVIAGEEVCVDPLDYMEREIVYQLEKDFDASNKVRVFLLNYNEDQTDDVSIEDNDYSLEILAPYSKKRRYDGATQIPDGDDATITVDSNETDESRGFDLPKN